MLKVIKNLYVKYANNKRLRELKAAGPGTRHPPSRYARSASFLGARNQLYDDFPTKCVITATELEGTQTYYTTYNEKAAKIAQELLAAQALKYELPVKYELEITPHDY